MALQLNDELHHYATYVCVCESVTKQLQPEEIKFLPFFNAEIIIVKIYEDDFALKK